MTFSPGDKVTFFHYNIICTGEIKAHDPRFGYRIHITGTLPPGLFGKSDITTWADEDTIKLEIKPKIESRA